MKIRVIDFGLQDAGLPLPLRAHDNDAGADVYSPQTVIVPPNGIVKIGLKFGIALPDGLVGFIFPRSSLSAKGIVCELPPIDAGYRGEIHAVVSNVSNFPYTIERGDRVGQLVILPVCTPDFTLAAGESRDAGAFGSTGR